MLTATPTRLALSELAPHQVQSEIRAMTVACDEMDGVNLAQGVCDTDPPHPVVEAAIQAIRSGHNIYTRHDGIAPLREGIAKKLAVYNNIAADPATEILVTSGATGALHAAVLALLNPGDECLLLEPFYGYHAMTLRAARVKAVSVPLEFGTWALDLDRLEAAVTPRTRAIILNSPSNPSGKVLTAHELQQLADFVLCHDLFVFSDEMYEYFLYDGARHLSIATLPGMAERTITISGFSKTFSVTGWRLGYLHASHQWLPAIGYFHDLLYVCAPAPLQHGAAAGLLALHDDFYADLATEYATKRDILCSALQRAGMNPSIPAGAYYTLADVTHLPGDDAKQKARWLLRGTGIAAVAGSAFFLSDSHGNNPGENLLRFCFAKKDSELKDASQRLASL